MTKLAPLAGLEIFCSHLPLADGVSSRFQTSVVLIDTQAGDGFAECVRACVMAVAVHVMYQ